MSQKTPLVTVLMPVYNGEKYLAEAIDSILQQEFTDFEFLIIDGTSTDNSVKIIKEYTDSRIRLIFRDKNSPGFASALNHGLALSRGKYIARMDCDDISYPDRLQKQIDFMDENKKVGVCGTWIIELIERKLGKVHKYPTSFDEIKVSLFFSSPLGHPSVMIRNSMFKENNLFYNTEFLYGEDFDLWNRCAEHFQLANLPEILLTYRKLSTSLYHTMVKKHPEQLKLIYKRNLSYLKIDLNEKNYQYHKILIRPCYLEDRKIIENVNLWILRIYKTNLKEKKYPLKLFNQYLANNWFRICFKSKRLGFWTWKTFWKSPISKDNTISMYLKLKFLVGAFFFNMLRIFKK
ncbi:MAG: glycosyltransferase [Candidatus Heimdallarchaeota archaeon]|nr:glycosyltransferase [Candidatus Heimdallarchaeota archaeon]